MKHIDQLAQHLERRATDIVVAVRRVGYESPQRLGRKCPTVVWRLDAPADGREGEACGLANLRVFVICELLEEGDLLSQQGIGQITYHAINMFHWHNLGNVAQRDSSFGSDRHVLPTSTPRRQTHAALLRHRRKTRTTRQ
jgi:hypothetical protein